MQKIIPHLWFDKEAEQAAKFYTSVFKKGKILEKSYYPEAGKEIHGMDAGTVLTVDFEIEGYNLIALNAGPHFKFTPAISITVHYETPEEVDEVWNKLIEGGEALMPLDSYFFSKRYGWVKDKYGLTWQLIYVEEKIDFKVMPSLMYVKDMAGKAQEAMDYYISIFKNSKIGRIERYGAGQEPDKEGTVIYGDFFLEGQKFAAMDSAHDHKFTFNEAVSLLVLCKTQKEIDYFFKKLSAVPESEQCGWVKDKYGVSWQIVPEGMGKIINNPDKKKANKAMEAMLKMKKLDIKKLKKAAA